MKELSVEEKAKRYDEAKYIMKEYLESGNAGIIAENTIKKAFPELAEPEEEKIRKWLIYYFKEVCDNVSEKEKKGILSWLEKQGEHANFRNKIQVGDKVTRNEAGILVNISQLNRIAKPRKQGEQKSVEWSEEDLSEFESYLCLMFQKFRTKGVCTNGEIVGFVKEHSQKLKDTLCHAWSEEDNAILEKCVGAVKSSCYSYSFKLEVENWLKSLKDRYTWKPSERQKEALLWCVVHLGGADKQTLGELLEELNKL